MMHGGSHGCDEKHAADTGEGCLFYSEERTTANRCGLLRRLRETIHAFHDGGLPRLKGPAGGSNKEKIADFLTANITGSCSLRASLPYFELPMSHAIQKVCR